MVWFDESLRFRLCTSGIDGHVSWMTEPQFKCTKPVCGSEDMPVTTTGIDGWKEKQ